MANKFKTFTAGAVLTAADQNTYLMNQVNIVCDAAADYPSAPLEGMTVYDKALDRELRYTGSSWVFVDLLTKPPGCFVRSSGTQSIPNNAQTAVNFSGTEIRDTDSFHSTSLNPERVTIPTGMGGFYRWEGTVSFAAGTVGTRILSTGFGASGAALTFQTALLMQPAVSGQNMFLSASVIVSAAAGDNVGMMVNQTEGAALNVTSGILSLTFLSPL